MSVFISLYRCILRAHRKYLPPDARFLGNKYVQQEFRLHRNIKNPLHLIGFIDSWKDYLKGIENYAWKEYKIESVKGKSFNFLFLDFKWYFSRQNVR